jgi:hypothetical protein
MPVPGMLLRIVRWGIRTGCGQHIWADGAHAGPLQQGMWDQLYVRLSLLQRYILTPASICQQELWQAGLCICGVECAGGACDGLSLVLWVALLLRCLVPRLTSLSLRGLAYSTLFDTRGAAGRAEHGWGVFKCACCLAYDWLERLSCMIKWLITRHMHLS